MPSVCNCLFFSWIVILFLTMSPRRCIYKCTLVQALRICTGLTTHRENKGTALLFLDHGTRRGWGVSVTHRPLFTSGKDPVPIVQEAGWAPGPVWTGVENLAPTGIRSPERPARSQSLYRLRYPGPSAAVKGSFNTALCLVLLSTNFVVL